MCDCETTTGSSRLLLHFCKLRALQSGYVWVKEFKSSRVNQLHQTFKRFRLKTRLHFKQVSA